MQAVVLTTSAHFQYEPTEDEVINYVAENENKNARLLIKPSLVENFELIMPEIAEKY